MLGGMNRVGKTWTINASCIHHHLALKYDFASTRTTLNEGQNNVVTIFLWTYAHDFVQTMFVENICNRKRPSMYYHQGY